MLGQHGILLEQQEQEFKEEQQLWHHLIDVSSPSMIASSTAQLEMRGDHWSPSWSHLASLVVGPWGNGSHDLHSLVRTLAKSKAAARSGARGWQGSDQELGLIMGEIRRALSLDFVNKKINGLKRKMIVFSLAILRIWHRNVITWAWL